MKVITFKGAKMIYFGFDTSLQRLDKVSNSGGALMIQMPKNILFSAFFSEK